jgi:hypothetical protein
MSEIFPTRIREGGIAVGTATQWLFNFTFSQITPHAVDNLGWRTFLMFAIFNWALVVYTWFFIKEVRVVTFILIYDLPYANNHFCNRRKGGLSRR